MTDTSVDNLAGAGAGLHVGRVLGRSITVLFRSYPKYILFGAVIALPNLITALYYGGIRAQALHASRPATWAITVLGLVVYALCQSAMVYGAFQDIRGRRFDLAASVSRGLRRFFPVLGTSIGFGIIVMLGMILLFIPGLIFLTMYLVAIPICVVEALGPIQSLDRSRKLTKGYRWQIFAIYIVPLVVFLVGFILCDTIGALLAGETGAAIFGFAISAAVSPYNAIVTIITYHDLRSAKEGLDIEQLAAVFD
jgi:hypothetical protein